MNLKAMTSIYKLLLIGMLFFSSSQICVAANICFYCQQSKKAPPYCQCKAHQDSHRESIIRLIEEIKTEVSAKQDAQQLLQGKYLEELNKFADEPLPLTQSQKEALIFIAQATNNGTNDANKLPEAQLLLEHKTHQIALLADVKAIFELFIQRLPQDHAKKCTHQLMKATITTSHSLATVMHPEQFPFKESFDNYLRVLFCILLKGIDNSGSHSFNSPFLELVYDVVLKKVDRHVLFEQLIKQEERDVQKVVRCNTLNGMLDKHIKNFHEQQHPHRKCLRLLASEAGQPDVTLKYVTLTKASPTQEQVKFYVHTLDLYAFEFDDASQFQTVTQNYLSGIKEENEARELKQRLEAMILGKISSPHAYKASEKLINFFSRHMNPVAAE